MALVLLNLHGATVTEELDEHCTHAILNLDDLSRLYDYREVNRRMTGRVEIVHDQWVIDSVKAGCLRQEKFYYITTTSSR